MMKYLLVHNQEHAAELTDMASVLRGAGHTAAAAKLTDGAEGLTRGSGALAEALALLGGGEG
ncbi:MAG: hypothetical protein LBL37_04955 [Gracilibacteraceae bacterium]|jgi:hypothetical protein|nr:hypothetical protein [Gracilibacteraceae bacterium]